MLKKKYIAAISGGPDSMAMLNMYKNKIQLVLHVNYNKRSDSCKDEEIVKNFCFKNSIKFEVLKLNENDYKKFQEIYKSNNFQKIARDIRYDFFYKHFNKEKHKALLVAHNLDDHLETYFMQKDKDTMSLFFGMKKLSSYKDMKLYRPLLIYRKSTLMRYCDQNNINYAIDSSNSLDIYKRNMVRKQINSMSSEQYYAKLIEIKKINNKNKKARKYVNKFILKWEQKEYSLVELKLCEKRYIDNVIFEFLKKIGNIKITRDKIILVKTHLLNSQKNSYLDLGRLKYLRIKNKRIFIYEGENKDEIRI